MRRYGLLILVVAALTMIVLPSAAFATNGYFSHGVGQKAKGMAGVGVAYPQDALVAGMNPAGMAFVGNRFDIGFEWFSPDRGSEIVENAFADGTYDANDKLIAEDGNSYTYDSNGNTLSKTEGFTTSYAYDYENRLISVLTPSSLIDYTYDADGVRRSAAVDARRRRPEPRPAARAPRSRGR